MKLQHFPQVLTFGKGLIIGSIATISFVAGIGMHKADPAQVVVGTVFKLVDAHGAIRGSWTVDQDEATFAMADTSGRTRVAIVLKEGPVIKFWGEHGENAMVISQDEKKGTWFLMFDQDGQARLDAQVHKELVFAELRGTDKKPRITAKQENNLPSELKVLDEDGNITWTATGDKKPASTEKGK